MSKITIMSSEIGTKINHLLKNWPQGTVAVSSWLKKQGVSQQLTYKYVQTDWVKSIGQGAFIKSGDHVSWEGALYAVQKQLGIQIHVAAKTALELQGNSHFVSAGRGQIIFIFGTPLSKLPAWFKRQEWDVSIECIRTHFLPSASFDLGITEVNLGSFSLQVSSRERAILEALYLVPNQQSYEEAKLLIEGLDTLRPKILQSLLEQCESIKVNRLFMHLAEASNHAWVKKIDLTKVNFGSGKRVIVKGGIFDPKYKITVPKIHEGGTDDPERP
jgi:hypothetical protein